MCSYLFFIIIYFINNYNVIKFCLRQAESTCFDLFTLRWEVLMISKTTKTVPDCRLYIIMSLLILILNDYKRNAL